ncbi:DUF998 domain-containing protein [Microbacterium sp. A82]
MSRSQTTPAKHLPAFWRQHWRLSDSESFALILAVGAFVVSGLIAVSVFWGRELPISGRQSVGEFAAISAAIAAVLSFAGSRLAVRYRLRSRSDRATRLRFQWFDLVALSLAHGVIALLGSLGLATVMQQSFLGATLYANPAAAIVAALTALSAFCAYLSGTAMSPRHLSLVLAVFLAVGMITAMLSSSDPRWWQLNLSALGITHDISSLTFNLTLIVSGVIITTIARFATAGLPSSTSSELRRRRIVWALFVLLGVMLSCVGLFPVNRFLVMHNTVATGMTVAFAVLTIALPWLVPSMPRIFLLLGFVYVAIIIGLVVLFVTGVYNLTAVELVSSVLIFSWIILFLRNVEPSGQHVPDVSGHARDPEERR